MASKQSNSSCHRHRLPPWKVLLNLTEQTMSDLFPGSTEYPVSLRADWENRIREGHKAENNRLAKRVKDLTASGDQKGRDLGDWLCEDVHQMKCITNAMYAAFVVSLWSDMEHFLKLLVRVCDLALATQSKALTDMRTFCDDALSGKTPQLMPIPCAKTLIKAFTTVYKFDEIKQAIKRDIDVELDQCTEFPTVDAIRILNNSFKHNAGRYRPDPDRNYTQIAPSLLAKWSVTDERGEIDYAEIPVRELVAACNAFSRDVITKIETELLHRAKEKERIDEAKPRN